MFALQPRRRGCSSDSGAEEATRFGPYPGYTVPIEIGLDAATLQALVAALLTLMGRDLSNTELAEALALSESTVKTHAARIFAKLALRDRAQAVVLAYETGLIAPGAPSPSTDIAW